MKNIQLEGRPWMVIATNGFGAKIQSEPKQKEGYWYIYQLYTTCFLEFKNLEDLKECITFLDKKDSYWNYDPITILKSGSHKHFMDLVYKENK